MKIGEDVLPPQRPFIGKVTKYSGAKDELFGPLGRLINGVQGRFFDPFTGSGSVFLYLARMGQLNGYAVIGDLNPDVTDLHRTVRDNPENLCEALRRLERDYNSLGTDEEREEIYYGVRTTFNETRHLAGRGPPDRVAMFIFLLRVGYNGVVRYNASREFNIAWSKRREVRFFPSTTPADTFDAVSLVMRHPGVTISLSDFDAIARQARPGDFVYLDPPYFNTTSATPGHYTPRGFPIEEQRRLKRLVDDLTARGIPILEDNNDDPFIRDLYRGYDQSIVTATEKVTQDPTQRGKRSEVIITNFNVLGQTPRGGQGTIDRYGGRP